MAKRSLLLLFCLSLFQLASPARAETDETAKFKEREALVHSMANATLCILQDQKKAYGDRQATLERGIMDMVDIHWIARFVLGSAWKSATDEQKQRYTGLYGAYLTKMYISNFAQSRERKIRDIKILGVTNSEADSFVARTEVALSTGQSIHVDYLVREENDTRKIIDITLEGVSLLTTHRAEFSKMAASQGIDSVISTLEQRVRGDVAPMELSMQTEGVAQPD